MAEVEATSPATKTLISSRISQMVSAVESGDTTESAVDPGAETSAASQAETSSSDSSTADPAVSPEQAEAQKAAEARLALIEAKLAEARDRRQRANEGKRAQRERETAEAERKAAAAERAKYEGLKQGTYKETLEALGRDPRQAFEEMQREMIEASTPEAQLKRIRADLERQLGETVEPLKKTIEQLQAENQAHAQAAYAGQLVSSFQADIQDPEYTNLRTEYDDSTLLEYVRHFDKNPKSLVEEAKRFGVRLTRSDGRFTMREALTVLKSAQGAHEQGRQQRAAKLAPAASSATSTPKVNGTAPRTGNAGTTIGNDVASERASPSRRLSRRERIDAEIDRLDKR